WTPQRSTRHWGPTVRSTREIPLGAPSKPPSLDPAGKPRPSICASEINVSDPVPSLPQPSNTRFTRRPYLSSDPRTYRRTSSSTSAQLAQPDQAIVSFDLHDGTNKSSPVCSVRMTQRGFQRNGDGGCAKVYDLHGFFCFECADFGDSPIICSTACSIGSNAL